MSQLTPVAFLIFFLTATNPFGIYGFSIKLISIDQFEATLFPKNLTLKEKYQRISKISRAHIYRLESTVSSSSTDQNESIKRKANALQPVVAMSDPFYYMTSLLVGRPPYSVNLVVDTGRVDTWLQCQGCDPCFPLRQGNFNRSRSQSYQPLPCNHLLCLPHLCRNKVCMYHQTVAECSYSKGQLGSDTFYFHSKGALKEFPKIVFGCGLDNYNVSWGRSGQNNIIAGVFGLGLGKRSIFVQYANETKYRMSYCLPSFYSHGASTYLQFGDDVQIGRRPGMLTTRLIPNVTSYAVEVIGISVDMKHLNIDPTVFRMRPDRTGGFILDSGCPHTVLVKKAYDIVKSEMIRYFFNHYSWRPLTPQPGSFELCYRIPHRNFTTPSMTYHFRGANLFLPGKNVFLVFNTTFCSTVMPINDRGPSILGALQQANHRFIFDFRAYTASFVPELCR